MVNAISFSTLACPNWTVEAVVEHAARYGYDALEWRGGTSGHIRPDLTPPRLAEIRQRQSDAGVHALAVTAYTTFVAEDALTRRDSLDDLQRHCDLAAGLGAAFVRVFVGHLPPGVTAEAVIERAAEGLAAAADYAQTLGVTLALEPHDDWVQPASVAPLLARVQHPALGVIWDFGNAYSAGVPLEAGWAVLAERLTYVQVKDGRGQGEDWRLTALGKGDVPLGRAIGLLAAAGYQGALSVEWEWAWHPELDPPEVALPAALEAVRGWLAAARAPLEHKSQGRRTSE